MGTGSSRPTNVHALERFVANVKTIVGLKAWSRASNRVDGRGHTDGHILGQMLLNLQQDIAPDIWEMVKSELQIYKESKRPAYTMVCPGCQQKMNVQCAAGNTWLVQITCPTKGCGTFASKPLATHTCEKNSYGEHLTNTGEWDSHEKRK